MSKQSLLLVDGDTRSLRVLEVSLRKAGFTVTTSESVRDALEKLEVHQPDLIVSETAFTDGDGFELRRRVRATPEWGDIPFIFLTAEQAIENKIRGLELGVDDYLTKPIYIKEIITRINILLQKRQRARFEERRDGRTRFAGRVSDMPVVDVIQTIEISRKSGVIQFLGERNKQATIYFRDGRVIDAEAGSLQGEDAVYRLLTWSDGEFEVVFRTVRRREVIQTSSQGLLMEGMRRLDEWSRILEQVPPLAHRFEVDAGELAARLGEVPDDNNRILRLIDGKRTLLEVIDASDVGDLECLQAIARLYFEEILIDLDWATGEKRRTTDRQMLVEMPEPPPTPIEDAASGPTTAQRRHETSGPRLMPSAPVAVPAAGSPAATPAFLDADQSATTDPVPVPKDDPSETQPTDAADVISEEDVPLTPLMGGFRPSSLRLIDEAVAAAQAIEPSLFAGMDDLDDAPLEPSAPPPSLASQVARLATPSILAATLPAIPPVAIGRAPTSPPVVVIPPVPVAAAVVDAGVPQAIESDEPSSPLSARTRSGRIPAQAAVARAPTPVTDVSASFGREDSGLRMIGSLGRDRAEASGELRPSQLMGAVAPPPETARELVTILPRRSTREIPIQTPPAGVTVDANGVVTSEAASAPSGRAAAASAVPTANGASAGPTTLRGTGVAAPASADPAAAASGATNADAEAGAMSGAIHEVANGSGATSGPRAVSTSEVAGASGPRGASTSEVAVSTSEVAGASGPRAVSTAEAATAVDTTVADERRELDSQRHKRTGGGTASSRGIGGGTVALIGLAIVLAAIAVYLKVRRHPAAAPIDAGSVVLAPPIADAATHAAAPDAALAAVTVDAPVPDAAVATAGHDASPAQVPVDAATAVPDPQLEAKALYTQAYSALEEHDDAKALTLAQQSLKLRRTARTFLLEASALQHLGKIDDAIDAIDAAIDIYKRNGSDNAAAWEQKGRVLWGSNRKDEARVAFNHYLELDPDSPRAKQIHRLIDEP